MTGYILKLMGLAFSHTVRISVNYNVPQTLNTVNQHINYGIYIFTSFKRPLMRALFMHNVLLLLQYGFLLA